MQQRAETSVNANGINFICVYENLFSSSFLLACDGVYPSRGETAFHNFGILEHFCGAFLLSVQQVAHTCQKRNDRFHSGLPMEKQETHGTEL